MTVINKKAISVDVDVKFHVETDTALQALNIIDIWLAENPDRKIEIEQFEDGTWCNNLIPAPDERETEKKTFKERFERHKARMKIEHPEITVYTREEWQKKKGCSENHSPK